MSSLSPLEATIVILGVVSLAGIAAAIIRRRSIFSGYRDIFASVQELRAAVQGNVFRDGADLVVAGTFQNWPVQMRFSNSENTPALNIRMHVPANLTLTLAPVGMPISDGGRVTIPTGEALFDLRFTARTNQPTQARLFMTRPVVALLQKLCCSSQTFLAVTPGVLEVNELLLPHDLGEHVTAHLQVMGRLAAELGQMPNASQVKVAPVRLERRLGSRTAIAAAALLTLGSVLALSRPGIHPVAAEAQPQLPAGIPPIDAGFLGDLSGWRMANSDDFSPGAVSWMIAQGVNPTGRIAADFSGRGTAADVAYVLVGPGEEKRVVMLSEHQNVFDSRFPALEIVARVPRQQVHSIQWTGGKGPGEAPGDGLLVVAGTGDQSSAVVLFFQNSRLLSFVPANYQDIKLQ